MMSDSLFLLPVVGILRYAQLECPENVSGKAPPGPHSSQRQEILCWLWPLTQDCMWDTTRHEVKP